jgi:hypothetical protein
MAPAPQIRNEKPETDFRIWQHILKSRKSKPNKMGSSSGSFTPVALSTVEDELEGIGVVSGDRWGM